MGRDGVDVMLCVMLWWVARLFLEVSCISVLPGGKFSEFGICKTKIERKCLCVGAAVCNIIPDIDNLNIFTVLTYDMRYVECGFTWY